jgi:hypothetical protein
VWKSPALRGSSGFAALSPSITSNGRPLAPSVIVSPSEESCSSPTIPL